MRLPDRRWYCRAATRLGGACVVSAIIGAASSVTAQTAVVPGGQISTTMAVTPYAIGFDVKNSTLYGLAPSGDAHVFGAINPVNGAFTQIPAGATVPVGSLYLTVMLTTDSVHHQMIIGRTDGDVSASTQTGAVAVNPAPSPSATDAFRYDSLSQQMLAKVPTGAATFPLATGAESLVSLYSFQPSGLAAVSAINPKGHVFYVEESATSGAVLDEIDEKTGVVHKVALAAPVLGLSFDYSSNQLYGVTTLTSTGSSGANNLVLIDTASGHERPIVNVGGPTTDFAVAQESALDDDDFLFVVNGSASLIGFDASATRAWYIEVLPTETLSALNSWMHDAGIAEGELALKVPSGEILNVVLDFGQPSQDAKGAFGATGFYRFLATSAIEMAVMNYATGYQSIVGSSPNAKLHIVIGTSNAQNKKKNNVTSSSGAAWSALVNRAATDIDTLGAGNAISVSGGMDIELLYSTYVTAAAWVGGFGGSASLTDYGDANDCRATSSSCANGWTKADVISLAGNYILPEIYSTGGGNAASWAALSLYAKTAGGAPLGFGGALTQVYACRQRPGQCAGTNNSPTAAWLQLTGDLAASSLQGATPLTAPSDIEHRVP